MTIKKYTVSTREAYVELMKELDEKGFKWGNGTKLIEDYDVWCDYKEETVISTNSNKRVTYEKSISVPYTRVVLVDKHIFDELDDLMRYQDTPFTILREVYTNEDEFPNLHRYLFLGYSVELDSSRQSEFLQYLDGNVKYMVKQAKQYRVKSLLNTNNYLNQERGTGGCHWGSAVETQWFKTTFTESEIKAINPILFHDDLLEEVE